MGREGNMQKYQQSLKKTKTQNTQNKTYVDPCNSSAYISNYELWGSWDTAVFVRAIKSDTISPLSAILILSKRFHIWILSMHWNQWDVDNISTQSL